MTAMRTIRRSVLLFLAVAWLAGEPINQAANSVEELLEFLAALFFLMMVGAFFSVRALGWRRPPDGSAQG